MRVYGDVCEKLDDDSLSHISEACCTYYSDLAKESGEDAVHPNSLHFQTISGKNDARDFWRFSRAPVESYLNCVCTFLI